LQVGDLVVVKNHGDQWPHQARIIEIDTEKMTMIKWETTQKTDSVDLGDLKRFSMEDSTFRKQKSTNFFSPISGKKIASNKQHQSDRSDIQHCTKNKIFSAMSTTKLCAEGAIGNLMNVLQCNEIDMNQFWCIVQSPIHLIQTILGESLMPKAVQKNLVANVIQLKKVFRFFVRN
jgi:hypothetical protein